MTVKELLSRCDSYELAEWAAYHSIEPIGGLRGDLQSGIVASTIANVNRGKNSKSYSPADFMLIGNDEKEPQTEEDMKAVMMGLATRTEKAK